MKTTKCYPTFIFFINLLLLIFITNIESKGQIEANENYFGIYYSDTVVTTPKLVNVYTIGIGKMGIVVRKINIERQDTSITITFPDKRQKTFRNKTAKRKSDEIIHEASLQNSSKFKNYDIVDKKDGSILLNVSFKDEYMLINTSSMPKISENEKLYRCTSYYENGKIKSSGGYRNGKKNGYWRLYNEDGEMTIKDFNNGIELK